MDNARMCVACQHPCMSAWAHYCPGHVVHAHTQQHMWQAALPFPCATAELRRCKQGCIKNGGGASQEADLTLLYLLRGHTPPSTSPLDPACVAAIILVDLRIVQFRCPASWRKFLGKFLWRTPPAEASLTSGQILVFSGG